MYFGCYCFRYETFHANIQLPSAVTLKTYEKKQDVQILNTLMRKIYHD